MPFVRTMYGIYAWAVLALMAVFTTLLVCLTPGLERRRRLAGGAARALFRLAGMPLRVGGVALPPGPAVVVANHASYLDGIILTAVLPPRYAFVVKREMATFPVAGLLLSRLGTHFVHRSDVHRGAADTRRFLRNAVAGEALAVFPEGTFRREPGLGPFRIGAFAAAARARIPVVPVVIHGSRDILPAGRLLPHPGVITVKVFEAIPCPGAGRVALRELREASREVIARHLGEPDLADGEEPAQALPDTAG